MARGCRTGLTTTQTRRCSRMKSIGSPACGPSPVARSMSPTPTRTPGAGSGPRFRTRITTRSGAFRSTTPTRRGRQAGRGGTKGSCPRLSSPTWSEDPHRSRPSTGTRRRTPSPACCGPTRTGQRCGRRHWRSGPGLTGLATPTSPSRRARLRVPGRRPTTCTCGACTATTFPREPAPRR